MTSIDPVDPISVSSSSTVLHSMGLAEAVSGGSNSLSAPEGERGVLYFGEYINYFGRGANAP